MKFQKTGALQANPETAFLSTDFNHQNTVGPAIDDATKATPSLLGILKDNLAKASKLAGMGVTQSIASRRDIPSETLPDGQFMGHNLAARRGAKLLFQGVNFSLNKGDVLVLRGSNGSGKTTLMRMLAGLTHAAAGKITWDGYNIADRRQNHAARMSYLGHMNAMHPQMTPWEMMQFWSRMPGTYTGPALNAPVNDISSGFDADRERDEYCEAVLDALNLWKLRRTPIAALSAGQKRRLCIGRLLLRPSELWVLDEPETALDAAGREMLWHHVAQRQEMGGIIVLSSHNDVPLKNVYTLSVGLDQQPWRK